MPTAPKKQWIRIRERKLGPYVSNKDRKKGLRCWGLAHPDPVIDVDPRQGSKNMMDSLLHETIHKLMPNLCEADVVSAAGTLKNVLWVMGYRRTYPEMTDWDRQSPWKGRKKKRP